MNSRLLSAALLLGAGLSACADTRTGYPSLAPRPVEREVMRAEVAPAAEAVQEAPPSPSADLLQIVAGAESADAAFRTALDKARPMIEAARGAPEGSEAWIAGQLGYSRADAARAPVAEALVELDRRREVAVDKGDTRGEAAIAEALGRVQTLYDAQLAALSALLPA